MLIKSIMFFLAFTFSVSADSFAVASVKKLGTAASSLNVAKPVTVLPKAQASAPSSSSLQAKASGASVGKSVAGDANSRLAGVSTIKTISSGSLTNILPDTTGTDTVNRVIDRVEILEGQNVVNSEKIEALESQAVTGVVESGNGNYVSDVSMGDDNKLNVTKTRLLYAPVRRGSSDAIVDDAEIWVVK